MEQQTVSLKTVFSGVLDLKNFGCSIHRLRLNASIVMLWEHQSRRVWIGIKFSKSSTTHSLYKQECIPVGCVPSVATWPSLPATPPTRHCHAMHTLSLHAPCNTRPPRPDTHYPVTSLLIGWMEITHFLLLLNKVGCVVIGDFQMDQYQLMLKVSLKSSSRDHIWSQKEGVSGTKYFYWVPLYGIRSFHASFHHFS